MIFDYRGFGHSEGKPDEPGILMDARAARDWLATRAGISPADIVLMGRSLGGGVAVDLAANDGAVMKSNRSNNCSFGSIKTERSVGTGPMSANRVHRFGKSCLKPLGGFLGLR